MIEITIPGRLPGENEIVSMSGSFQSRGSKRLYLYQREKADIEDRVGRLIPGKYRSRRVAPLQRFSIEIQWVEPNNKRDPDNIAAGIKFILDAFKRFGLIANDGRKNVTSIKHEFFTDSKNPRIVVKLLPSTI